MLIIFSLCNAFLQAKATQKKGDTDYSSVKHNRIFLDLFEWSKGGKMLFNILSIYILFVSKKTKSKKIYKNKKREKKIFKRN